MYTPSLHVNGSLSLAIGSMKALDFSLLNVQHQKGRVQDLLFHVVSTPTNGQLVLSRNGKEAQLDKAGHFSWKDVNEKKVRFLHSKGKLRWVKLLSSLHLLPFIAWFSSLSLSQELSLFWGRSISH